MFGQRAVTRLTVHASMLTGAVHLGLLLVAENTLIVAGERDWMGTDDPERTCSVVPVLSKVFRDNEGAKNQEDQDTR